MANLWSDIRQALRTFASQPGHTAATLITLALGIGAAATVFNVANWMALRPLPGVHRTDRLVTVLNAFQNSAIGPISVPTADALAAGMPSVSGLAGYTEFAMHLTAASGQPPRRLKSLVVNGPYFEVLSGGESGLFARGRGFTRDEVQSPAAPPTAVVSYGYWQQDLGGDPNVIGRSIFVNGHAFSVIGVAARGFGGASRLTTADVWLPIGQHHLILSTYSAGLLKNQNERILSALVGRLRHDATVQRASVEAEAVRASLAAAFPKDTRMARWRFSVQSGVDSAPWEREQIATAFSMLAGVVALLLILTCANAGNLMLARAVARRVEIATRLAVGASRGRIVRMLLIESALLSIMAGVAAVMLAAIVGVAIEGTLILRNAPAVGVVLVDRRVFLFAAALSAIVAVAAGLVPALGGIRVDMQSTLKDAGRSGMTSRRRLRQALTVAQVAISVTFLAGAIMLIQSMRARHAIDPGFAPERVLTFSVEPRLQGYTAARREDLFRSILAKVRAIPGVTAAGSSWAQPYSPTAADRELSAEDRPDVKVDTEYNRVSPGFFAAMGLKMIAGRDFEERELVAAAADPDFGPIVISEAAAKKLYGSAAAAVGRTPAVSYPQAAHRTVVGVVADMRQRRFIAAAEAMVFEPMSPSFMAWASVQLQIVVPAGTVIPQLARVMFEVDPQLPIYDVMTLRDAANDQIADSQLMTTVTSVFAALATLIAAFGLFGVLARGVTERQHEFSVRMALGAAPHVIARLIGNEAFCMTAVGVVVGLASTFGLSRFLQHWLYGVTPRDPAAMALAVIVFLAMTMAALAIPVRRAAATDPARGLR